MKTKTFLGRAAGLVAALLLLLPSDGKCRQLDLSSKILPFTRDNVFLDPGYYHWCNSIIKGDDGRYHLFYARWERERTFHAWMTHSQVAHAVADRPEGPYTYLETVLDFRKDEIPAGSLITAHNPKIRRFGDKYYLYFVSSHMDHDITGDQLDLSCLQGKDNPFKVELRNNLRTYVAVSNSLSGPWKIRKEPLLEPKTGLVEHVVVNPAVTQGPDGRYFMIVKGDQPGSGPGIEKYFKRNQAVAVSDRPDRGFVYQDEPAIEDWVTEDASIWYSPDTRRFYFIFHAHTYLGMMTSEDGIHWEKAENFEVLRKSIRIQGRKDRFVPERMERPFVYIEDGQERVLSMAIRKGDDAFVLFLPLRH